ncbi:MAG: xanthine dehydrogenase family protein molybdopterin-binding subunit, partial [Caldilineae bacterium]
NALRDGSILATGSPVPPGCTALEVLEEAARWYEEGIGDWRLEIGDRGLGDPLSQSPNLQSPDLPSPRHPVTQSPSHPITARGRGIALSYKNVGFSLGFPEHCHAWVELEGGAEIERARVGCVGADVGQGAHTAMVQIAAEVLGLAPEQIELLAEDTDVTGSSGSSSASRMTFMAGSAIKGAAELALARWQDEERPARAEYVFHPRRTTPYDRQTGASDPNITYGYCAQVADVEVDLETGQVRVARLVSVNDVGKAVNPQQVEGQIEGAVAQSVGWTLLEHFIQQDGRAVTTHLSTYLIPGVEDVAQQVIPVILEHPDPQGPLGVRGMAEMPFIPTAPAIVAAVHDAIGVWFDELPLTPERVWRQLRTG